MYENKKVLLALGNFDGLHLGHQKVLLSDKSEYDVKIALMFSVHPQKVLTGAAPGELADKEDLESILSDLGFVPEYLDFTDISNFTPEQFVDEIVVGKYNADALECGFNYRFGKGARGDTKLLSMLCAEREITLTVCDEVDFEGKPISSSRIRECLRKGDIQSANKMLGRNFSYNLTVVHGDARGRVLGSPTVNQFFTEDFTVPDYGVYASVTTVEGKRYPSVTNIGIRPTIDDENHKRSETNIVGFDGDLYGQKVKVELIEKLRGEIKFSSLKSLSEQISADRQKSIEITKNLI